MGHLMQFGVAMFELPTKERADEAERWKHEKLLGISEFQKAFPDAKLVAGTLGSTARPPN